MTSPAQKPPVGDLKELVTWQVAIDFAERIYQRTRRFPDDEKLGLRRQLRRAAISVASNIAEGHGRTRSGDYVRFAFYARGSLKECETQILIAQRLGFFDSEVATELLALTSRCNRLLTGLIKRLQR